MPRWWIAVVPVLDIAVAGAMHDVFRVEASAVALFAVLPTLWLADAFRQIGNIVGTVAVLITISLPIVLRALPEVDSVVITRSLLASLVVAQIGVMVALARSLTRDERSRAQAALRQKKELLAPAEAQERQLENILDTIDMGVLILDRKGRTVRTNRAHADLCRFALPPGWSARARPSSCSVSRTQGSRSPNCNDRSPERRTTRRSATTSSGSDRPAGRAGRYRPPPGRSSTWTAATTERSSCSRT